MNTPFRLLFLLIIASSPLLGQEWVHTMVADEVGGSPSIQLDDQDVPIIAFSNPSLAQIRVYLATWNSTLGSFDKETAFDGGDQYVTLVLDHDQAPHIIQHIHSMGGEMVHHYRDAGAWTTEVVAHPGHDGWSNNPVIDSQNRLRVSTIDPQCCSSQGRGVEYQRFDGTTWFHEIIGSEFDVGPWTGTSIVLDSLDVPRIAYYDNVTGDLMLARRLPNTWLIETVDSVGDVGRYPALKLDSAGEPVIAYYEAFTDSTGSIKVARHSVSGWTHSTIDYLNDVVIAPTPGRISMVIDGDDKCHLSYSDQDVLKYAIVSETETDIETIFDFTQSDTTLGWITSLDLDSQGRPHLAYFMEISEGKRCMYAYKPAIIPETAFRVNAGGTGYTAISGSVFSADQAYTAGSFGYSGGTARPLHKTIAGTEDDPLYQSYREGIFSYLFDLPNDSYDVTCHFVEPRATVAGRRVFDIHAENLLAVDDHDIFAVTGAPRIANTVTFPVDVSDGQLNLDFLQVSVKGLPLVAAIEVVPSASESPRLATQAADGLFLERNYPNPFNPTTSFRYQITTPGRASLKIFDALGREVETLMDDVLQPGTYTARWNAVGMASGTYFCRLISAAGVRTQKLILMK